MKMSKFQLSLLVIGLLFIIVGYVFSPVAILVTVGAWIWMALIYIERRRLEKENKATLM